MSIPDYFKNISRRLNSDSEEIRSFFSSHRPSAGSNREGLIVDFLNDHLPKKYEISHGLIFSSEGEFSNQADIVIADKHNNVPLFSDRNEPIWLVEAIFSLIEVKTTLSPSVLDDCISKCKRFKGLNRNPSDRNIEKIRDSLFVVWAFDGPSPESFKNTIVDKYKDLPVEQTPDFIIVPGKYVCMAGQYRELCRLGQKGSLHRQQIESQPEALERLNQRGFEIAVLNEHTLLASMVWLSSWLHQAGERYAPLTKYLPAILESDSDYQLLT
ncbi:DUF6602 domain-containing protein [Methylophaga thalassica]|uniref:DUF6602 domain-containing protein n=1 Tax=Methylophaga thalassica TaxID=40223 RepID=UPI002E7C1C64|nr:DUF6602 domain-containing protein [Methylophaga thalassica]WVI84896.1 DUF6602 domain-containing protein [Methylophaga thalassica]